MSEFQGIGFKRGMSRTLQQPILKNENTSLLEKLRVQVQFQNRSPAFFQ